MKNGKKIIVAILIVLSLLLIAVGAFAYIYLATDILKTDKELFFSYFAQIAEEDGFIDSRIQQYYEQKMQKPYENYGELKIKAAYPNEELEEIIKKVNELSIRFTGKVDSRNQKVEQNIEIDYGNDVIFPINYKQDGNKFGIQTNELSKQYIAIRNENLKQFATKFGIEDVSEIPDQIELPNVNQEEIFTEEELEQLKQLYMPVLQEQLLDENFSSVKTEKNVSYSLELSSEQVKNIIIKILEATKQNSLIIDKINEIMLKVDSEAEKIDISVIDDLIDDINEEDISNIPNLKLIVVQNNKKLNYVLIQLGENQISIYKTNPENSLKYDINCQLKDDDETTSLEKIEAYFNVQYTGLENMTNIQENYEFGISTIDEEETLGYDYKINTNTQFVDSVSIDVLDESGAVFLNDHDANGIINFLTQVGTKLFEINKNQMTKLGLEEDQNPLLFSNPISILVIMLNDMASENIEGVDLSQLEMNQFNERFTTYVGDEVSGEDVNELITTVQNHLLSSSGSVGRFVKITLDGTELSEKVDSNKTYSVDAIYDENGYIIEMKVTTKN